MGRDGTPPPLCARHRGRWCAVNDPDSFDPGAQVIPTRCGFIVPHPSGAQHRAPTCLDCARKGTP